METPVGWVASIGYEGRTPEALVDELLALGVTTLIDVRLNPISRKRGFSKTALGGILRDHGIEYLHRPTLGNPRDNRDGYAENRTTVGDAARARFRELLRAADAEAALVELTELAQTGTVALLCFEASELHCHRKQVLDELRDRIDSLQPV